MTLQVGFVGIGAVGRALAQALYHAEIAIVAVNNRGQYAETAELVGATIFAGPAEVVAVSDLTFLTVPDDAITEVADDIVEAGVALDGKVIVHTSGAHSSSSLAAVAAKGATVGGFHPAYPFAGGELPEGIAFGVETSDVNLQRVLTNFAEALGGVVIVIPPDKKVLYHAAMVIVSNYTVTLFSLAEALLSEVSDSRGNEGRAALWRLLSATVGNLGQDTATANVLTGPIARGDIGTVSAHLDALDTFAPEVGALYQLLGRETLPLAVRLDEMQLSQLRALLS